MAAPPPDAALDQVERFEFMVRFPGAPYPGLTVDESPPTGRDHGPSPVRSLAMAVGHCMSSTLASTLERAHVAVAPMRTTVRATIGRNDRGRLRVRALEVEIATAPLSPEDRERFEHAVEVFADYCTVSGAVREGIPITHRVGPTPG
ncbi:MAG TPA: OsmC family protein [Thermoplasmata archaeon]|nr:OsmC family protein [Thermoplasmata archaeon]